MLEAACVAAKWWKEQLSSTYISKYTHMLDKENPIVILNYLLQTKCTPSQLRSFQRNLERRIEDELQSNPELRLYSCYYPCELLEGAGNFCNIDGLSFPLFVEMFVTKKLVKVRFMDSEEFEILYEEKGDK